MDENSQVTHPTFIYTYDIFGNTLTTIDPKGFITTKTYNLRGDPTDISYPDGSFELFKYDAEGSLHRSFTREQIITVYEYDYLGRSIYEECSTAGETGVSAFLLSRSRQYNGFRCRYEREDNLIKRYAFDAAGRLASITESNGGELYSETRLTEFIYDSLSRVQYKRVWFDTKPQDYSVECYSYDLAGNITEKKMEDAQGSILLNKNYSYNLQDQCVEEYYLENGLKTILNQRVYNLQREPILYRDGLNHETAIIIDNFHKNSLGQTVLKKTMINSIGMQTEIEFDTLGRICCLLKKDLFGLTLSSQKILYDSLGNKACEIHDQIVDGKINSSQKMRWRYGPMGRLEEETQAADSPSEQQTRYSYNSLGKLINRSMSGVAASIDYTYNKNGDLHKVEAQNNKNELRISNSYSYDRQGNIISAHSLYGKSVFRTYNIFNQVLKETIKDGEGSYESQYVYDRKGRLKEIILPDTSKIAYVYDAVFGREVKRISPQGDVLYTHTYDGYDHQGKLLKENYIGYVGSQEYSYDLNAKKIARTNDYSSEQYVRDTVGRITEIKGEKEEKYTYNSLSQLTSETKTATKTYVYDSLDNCIKADNEELLYNALNQLTSKSDVAFSYDPQGNLLKKALDNEETHLESNILSQLISIEKTDQTLLTYSYDPFGRLLVEKHFDIKGKKKKTLSTSRYFYLGYQEIGTLAQEGVIETLKIPGLRGNEISPSSIAFEIKKEVYAPIHDIAGNVIYLIDPQSRGVLESYQYSAFGNEKSSAKTKFLMICHSQGAIHVRNALLDYSPELRARILVVAIAPGGYIYQETCAEVIHYRAEWYRDCIPRLDREGAIREHDTTVTLASHANAPYFDHEFMSPTYLETLQWHINNYIRTKGKEL